MPLDSLPEYPSVRYRCFGTEIEHPAGVGDEQIFTIIGSFPVPRDGVAIVTTVIYFYNPRVYTATPAGQYEQFCP